MAILPACDHRAAIAPKAPDSAAQIHGAAQAQRLMRGSLGGLKPSKTSRIAWLEPS